MHTANLGPERRRSFRGLVDIALALDFLSADPMRLIPMQLRRPYRSTPQANQGNALEFPPAPPPVESAESLEISNSRSHRDRVRLRDLADDLEGHYRSL